ncbi:CHAD domain-containing protein [Thiosulfatimonas sediminis]|uniref:CHAD domain-containing protein n=1 Tax=Thiosulfatimonas sediminis TaxID=2675054 RepID=UPI001565FF1B|nr:CHAD domain-containing protein [Thiosulfatimonas sediminis]
MLNIDKKSQVDLLLRCANAYLQLPPKLKAQAKGLHKLRQTTRHLLSLLPIEGYAQARIKKVIQASNKIRDLDVLLWDVLPHLPDELRVLEAQVQPRLIAIRCGMDDEFKNDLQLELLPEITSCLVAYPHVLQAEFSLVSQLKRPQISDLEKQFQKAKKQLVLLDIENTQVHKLRLKIKRIRYQVGHFFPEQTEFLMRLRSLQDQLGEFHDYDQADKMMCKYSDLDELMLVKVRKFLAARQQNILAQVRRKLAAEKTALSGFCLAEG